MPPQAPSLFGVQQTSTPAMAPASSPQPAPTQQLNINNLPAGYSVAGSGGANQGQKMNINSLPSGYSVAGTNAPSQSQSQGGGILSTLFGGANKVLRTVQSVGAMAVGAGQKVIGKVTGNKNLSQSGSDLIAGANANQPQPVLPKGNVAGGALGQYLGQSETPLGYDSSGKKLSTGQGVKQAAGIGAQLAPYFFGGDALGKGVGWLSRLSASALGGASFFGGAEAQNPKSTAKSIAGQSLFGAATAPLVEAGVEGGAKALGGVINSVKNIVDPDVEEAFTRAIKPAKKNTGWANDIKSALPEIADTLNSKGVDVKNMTMDDLKDAIKDTKTRIWDKYEQMVSPNKHATIDVGPIADNIESGITKRMQTLYPDLADNVTKMADKYRKLGTMTLGDAEDFLQDANADLQSYYAKNKVGQKAAMQDPAISSTVKEAEGLRTALYSKLDDLTGEASAPIKKLYGSLTNIQNEVEGRAQVVARQAPASLQETIHTPLAVAKAIGSAARLDIGGVAEAAGQIGMSQAMKAANSTEGLIQKAFQKILENVP